MKQYYETMAKLRYWRRDIEESNEDYDEILQSKKLKTLFIRNIVFFL